MHFSVSFLKADCAPCICQWSRTIAWIAFLNATTPCFFCNLVRGPCAASELHHSLAEVFCAFYHLQDFWEWFWVSFLPSSWPRVTLKTWGDSVSRFEISRQHPDWSFSRELFGKQMIYKGAWKECNVFYCAWGDHNLRKILVFSLRKASFCTLNLEVICALLSCGWEHPAFDSPPSRLTEGGEKRGMNMNKSSGKI